MAKKQHINGGVMRMEAVREIIRLSETGASQREIAAVLKLPKTTVQNYQKLAKLYGLKYAEIKEKPDAELKAVLKKSNPGQERKEVKEPDYGEVATELKSRKGVTLALLWEEWMNRTLLPNYSYSTFCRRYNEWHKSQKVSLKREYEAGVRAEIDYAGAKLSWYSETDEEQKAEIFVAVLCASNYIYAEASQSQQLEQWINSNIRALEYFQGAPEVIVIDNLKSGVNKSCRYEPIINKAYQEFSEHYQVSIMPARARKPQDKAKVEKAVQDVERWVLAPLRKERFSSLSELNIALSKELIKLNQRKMQTYNASRIELYEQLDKPALAALPVRRHEYSNWKIAKVSMDYHIQIKQHYYSVPFSLARQEVWVKTGENLVEIFHNNEKVASHKASAIAYRFSTTPAHMPPNHLAYRSHTAESLMYWAKDIGSETKEQVARMLATPEYKELSYRSILGLKRLEKTYGAERLEIACKQANQTKSKGQRLIKSIIETNLLAETKIEFKDVEPLIHSNLRGSKYYH
jgi:transposase